MSVPRFRRAPALPLLALAAAAPLAPPPRMHIIAVTKQPGYFNEPAVAIDPRDPARAIIAYQKGGHAAYTTDGGQTWVPSKNTVMAGYKVAGDVSLAFDLKGNAYFCHIAFDKLGTVNYWAHNATRNAILVHRSRDGGKSWETATAPIAVPTGKSIPFEDKSVIVADTSPSSPHANTLYVGWTEFTLTQTRMLFARSTDGGRSWSVPQQISTHPGAPRDDNGATEGFTAATDADGTLYAAWADGQGMLVTVSRDGGATFSRPGLAATTPAAYYAIDGIDRANGFPGLAVDPRTHRVTLVWADGRNGEIDVFAAHSDDRGATWSPPAQVNTDPPHSGADHFFPALALDPADGSLDVVFYDRRGDPRNRKMGVTLARSTDGGDHWTNDRLPTPPFDAKNDFIGDYLGLAARNGRVIAAWSREAPGKRNKHEKLHLVVEAGSADFR